MKAGLVARLDDSSEECVEGIEGSHRPEDASTETDHIGIVVLLGQGGRRHIIDERGPDARDLVGSDGDADPGPADRHAEVARSTDHGPAHGRTEVGVVN